MNRPLSLIGRVNRRSVPLLFASITAIVVSTSLITSAALEADAQAVVDLRLRTRIERVAERLVGGKDPAKQLLAASAGQKGVQIALARSGEIVALSGATVESFAALAGQSATVGRAITYWSTEISANEITTPIRAAAVRLPSEAILIAFVAAPRNAGALGSGDVLRKLALLLAISGVGGGCLYVLLRQAAFRPLDRSLRREQRLIADASHEMRTTAAVISAGVELLEERDAVDPAQHLLLSDLRAESVRLNRMVADLIKRSSLPRDVPNLSVEHEDLRELVERAVRRASLISPKSVAVEIEAGQLAHRSIVVDRAAMESALDAVLENAVLHAARRVVVGCSIAGGSVTILVDDDGPGIAAEHREAVLQPFSRIESHRGSPGSGLGLSIAHAAMQRLGGALMVEASPLGGARIRLLLAG